MSRLRYHVRVEATALACGTAELELSTLDEDGGCTTIDILTPREARRLADELSNYAARAETMLARHRSTTGRPSPGVHVARARNGGSR